MLVDNKTNMGQTIDEIRMIIEARDWAKLKGQAEGFHFDAKEQIYALKDESNKLELAKDVSAFANAEGGYIFIGAKTLVNPSHRGEEISELRPFHRSLLDLSKYRSILRDWIYPDIFNLRISWEAENEGADRGFGIIAVEPQFDRKPFLIRKSLPEPSGKISHVVFGYAHQTNGDWEIDEKIIAIDESRN